MAWRGRIAAGSAPGQLPRDGIAHDGFPFHEPAVSVAPVSVAIDRIRKAQDPGFRAGPFGETPNARRPKGAGRTEKIPLGFVFQPGTLNGEVAASVAAMRPEPPSVVHPAWSRVRGRLCASLDHKSRQPHAARRRVGSGKHEPVGPADESLPPKCRGRRSGPPRLQRRSTEHPPVSAPRFVRKIGERVLRAARLSRTRRSIRH